MKADIKLGDRVEDRITHLSGIVVGITDWLYGCTRLMIQPEEAKDGKPIDTFCIDIQQCVLIKAGVLDPNGAVDKTGKERPGGPQADNRNTRWRDKPTKAT